MEGRGRAVNKCERYLKRCEVKLATALDILKDVDMKLTHIIEKMKNQNNLVDIAYH